MQEQSCVVSQKGETMPTDYNSRGGGYNPFIRGYSSGGGSSGGGGGRNRGPRKCNARGCVDGKVGCNRCEDTGFVQHRKCNGEGFYPGTSIMCHGCQGTGQVLCRRCEGAGQLDCRRCGGTGYID